MINFNELTLGELEEMELLVGQAVDVAFADGNPKGRALRALYYVVMKRDNPKYDFADTATVTQEEALKILKTDPKE